MRDLAVTISIAFALVAHLALPWAMWAGRQTRLFAAGCQCLAVLVASVTSYHTGLYFALLPWAQRVAFVLSAGRLTALDWRFSRHRLGESKGA
jgi:hypothetical protein